MYKDAIFFQQYEKNGKGTALPPGIYGLDEMKEYGQKNGWCPYFLARSAVSTAPWCNMTMSCSYSHAYVQIRGLKTASFLEFPPLSQYYGRAITV